MSCKRPEGIPFPNVWWRFQRTKPDGSVVKFKIQDAPTELYGDVMDFMMDHFMKDEALNKGIGIEYDELAVKEFYDLQFSCFKHKMIIICTLDDDVEYDMINKKPEILGFNLMMVVKKGVEHFDLKVKSKEMIKLFKVFEEFDRADDAFERFNIDEFIGDAGLSVHPDYRGFGMGVELLKARNAFCKAYGAKISAAAFTSAVSQKIAIKCGYEAYQDIPYTLIENVTDSKYDDSTASIKLMAYIIE